MENLIFIKNDLIIKYKKIKEKDYEWEKIRSDDHDFDF